MKTDDALKTRNTLIETAQHGEYGFRTSAPRLQTVAAPAVAYADPGWL